MSKPKIKKLKPKEARRTCQRHGKNAAIILYIGDGQVSYASYGVSRGYDKMADDLGQQYVAHTIQFVKTLIGEKKEEKRIITPVDADSRIIIPGGRR